MENRASELLQLYGLSPREALVYLHVLRSGSSSAGKIARALSLRRMEAYRLVKKLTDSNFIVANAGKPVTYSAQPVESILATVLDSQLERNKAMEAAREELLKLSRVLPRGAATQPEQQFRIIQGREQIYGRMTRMAESAEKSLDLLLTKNDLVQAHSMGMSDRLNDAAGRGVRVRVLTHVDDMTLEASEAVSEKCDLRHSDGAATGRLVVADKSDTLSSLVLDDSRGRRNERDIAIWSVGPNYAEMMSSLFDVAYKSSVNGAARMEMVRESQASGERVKALAEVLRATLPDDGWAVSAPGILTGRSGDNYEFAVTATKGEKVYAIDILAASNEAGAKDMVTQSVMKKLDLKDAEIVVVSTKNAGEDVSKLANLLGVSVVQQEDTLAGVSEIRKLMRATA